MTLKASFFSADFFHFNFTCLKEYTFLELPDKSRLVQNFSYAKIKKKKYKAFSFNGMSLAWKLCSIVLRDISYAALPTTGIQKS